MRQAADERIPRQLRAHYLQANTKCKAAEGKCRRLETGLRRMCVTTDGLPRPQAGTAFDERQVEEYDDLFRLTKDFAHLCKQ